MASGVVHLIDNPPTGGTDAPSCDATKCTIPFGDEVTVDLSHYTVQLQDVGSSALGQDTLSDIANFSYRQVCDKPVAGFPCSTALSISGSGAATDVNPVPTTTATEIHNNAGGGLVTSVAAGTTVHDFVTVTGPADQPAPTGTVDVQWFTDGGCTQPFTSHKIETLVPGADGVSTVDATDFPQGPLAAGNYSFQANYLGDGNAPSQFAPSPGACEPLTVVSPTTVTSVTSTTANGAYRFGATMSVTVAFSESVVVTGTPQLALNSGATINYSSGSGTSTLTFSYTVGATDNSADLDYTSASSLMLNGGTINNGANNPADLTLPAPGTTGSLGANKNIVIDTIAPTVTCSTTPTFLLGSTGNHVSATVTDPGGSGPASSPVQAAAPATSAGPHTASVTGTDKAGNTTTLSCPYVVGYKFGGFTSPLPKSNVKSGSTLPLKFQLQDAAGHPISDTEAQSLLTPSCKIAIILVKPAGAVSGCPTYSTTSKQFQLNLKTNDTMKGANGVSITVTIGGTIVTASAPPDPFTVK